MNGLASSVGILIVLVVVCLFYVMDPDKKRSNFIGYRTKLSRSSEENWRLSQKLFYILAISCQLVLVLANVLFDISTSLNFWLLLGYMLIVVAIIQSILHNKQKRS